MAVRFQQGTISSQDAPAGVVQAFAGSAAPTGWLLCDGSAISRTTYAALFAALSTTFGAGDGSTTFNLPDMRGVYARGVGTNGTANYGGVSGHTPAGGTLGSKGGQKTAPNGLATGTTGSSHSHGVSDPGHTHPYTTIFANTPVRNDIGNILVTKDGTGANTTSATTGISTNTTGSTHTHNITGDTETTPAFLALNYIIKF